MAAFFLAAFTSAPAGAQTVTISASGDCGGTAANCGAPANRNGDRDTTWPGLQVNEGDTVTFRVEARPASGLLTFRFSLIGAAANTTDLGQIRGSGANSGNVVGIPNRYSYTLSAAGGYVQNILVPVSTDSASESDESLTFRIDSFINAATLASLPIPSPSSVTITIRGADSAPTFGSGAVPAKTFTAGAAVTEFQIPAATGGNGATSYAASGLPAGLRFDATGTDSPGCPGTEPREVCGTPTTPTTGAATVTITATDADSNTANADSASLTFPVTVNAGADLTVTLPTGFTFSAGVSAASFELATSPTINGLSIDSITGGAAGSTSAVLTLAAGTGYGFDNAATLAVRVLDAAHSGTGDLTTGALAVSPSAPAGVTVSRATLRRRRAPVRLKRQSRH